VRLAWALGPDGGLVPVSAVDPGVRAALGPFSCPGCREPLLPRLGRERAHHFAHRPGATCPLTAPETALHFNAKARLLELARLAVAGKLRVTLLARCPACRRADPRDLGALGDEAGPEGAVGSLRADVLVRRGGRPALALEVVVTHPLGPEKVAALAAAGVPAVEVDAAAGWEREGATGAEVVPIRAVGFPPCGACAALARADRDRERGEEAAVIAELEAYRARGLLPVEHLGGAGRARRRSLPRVISGDRSGTAPSTAHPLESQDLEDLSSSLTEREREAIRGVFDCPDCHRRSLEEGLRLMRHPCPGHGLRPVAWRGYDGLVATLSWWKRRGT
jgi:hypothetical protein